MSRRGYNFEREIEVWLCEIFDLDIKSDFTLRPFRTASSGAISSCKGDIRTHQVPWLESLTFEAKHLNQWTKKKGAVFHLYVDWVHKLKEEARSPNSIPIFTWAFKGVRTNRGQGRIQMAVPRKNFDEWSRVVGIGYIVKNDVIRYNDKRRKHFLIYHDELWKHAKLGGVTVFPFSLPCSQQDHEPWVVVSRLHLEQIFIAMRNEWKIKTNSELTLFLPFMEEELG